MNLRAKKHSINKIYLLWNGSIRFWHFKRYLNGCDSQSETQTEWMSEPANKRESEKIVVSKSRLTVKLLCWKCVISFAVCVCALLCVSHKINANVCILLSDGSFSTIIHALACKTATTHRLASNLCHCSVNINSNIRCFQKCLCVAFCRNGSRKR